MAEGAVLPGPLTEPVVTGRSLWVDARARLVRNKAAVTGMILLGLIAVACLFGPALTGHPYDTVYPDYVRVCNSFNVPCERVMFRRDLRAALQRMLDAKTPYVLDVVTPYSEHVMPFIPAGRTVADMIWKL